LKRNGDVEDIIENTSRNIFFSSFFILKSSNPLPTQLGVNKLESNNTFSQKYHNARFFFFLFLEIKLPRLLQAKITKAIVIIQRNV